MTSFFRERKNWIGIRTISAVIIAYTISAICTFLLTLILKKGGIQFRVSKEEEEKGLGLTEHGEKFYIFKI